MSIDAIIGMVLCLGIVMGGFVFFLRIAINKERNNN